MDLYEYMFDKVVFIQNFCEYLYEFYEKLGYKIVGVLLNVNGWDKLDIWMVKMIIF